MSRTVNPLLLLALFGCGGDEPEDSGPAVDPLTEVSEPGPYGAGYRESELTWTDADTGDRTLRLAIWYPSDETTGPELKYQGLFEAPGAILEPTVAAGPHPLVVFSHGHLAYAEAASFLAVHLASHGVVVVAPDHFGNTTFDGDNRETPIYVHRPLDLSAVLDHLEALPASDPLAGQITVDGAVAWGHSFGGYTIFANAGATYDLPGIEAGCAANPDDPICTDWDGWSDRFLPGFAEPRFAGGLVMASGDYARFGATGVAAVQVPILTMTGGLDPGANNEEYWEALVGPEHRRVHFEHAAHNSFTDFAGILDQQEGLLDPEQGKTAMAAYALAWVRHLGGSDRYDGLLDGSVEVHADAKVTQK